jgi:hypothetical protein
MSAPNIGVDAIAAEFSSRYSLPVTVVRNWAVVVWGLEIVFGTGTNVYPLEPTEVGEWVETARAQIVRVLSVRPFHCS